VSEFLHECVRWPLRFRLSNEGRLTVRNLETGEEKEEHWYTDGRSGKPWLVRKAKSFKGLIATADKDGEYDDMKKG